MARSALATALVSIGLLVAGAVGSSASAKLAKEFGPSVSLAEPSGGFVGQIALAPEHGTAGTPVTVKGRNFPKDRDFDLAWRTMDGRWNTNDKGEYHGRSYAPVAYRIARVHSDVQGNFEAHFTTPEDFGFQHDIVVQDGNRLLTQAGFDIDMTMDVTPASGPVGTPITVEFKGIGWRQLENSWDLVYDNAFTGWVSSVTTNGTARFTIPATGRPGVHVLEAIHGEFTFPYRNPQQNPRPDRPRFVKQFTITPGAPVLPPAPEAQLQTAPRGLPPQGDLKADPPFAPVGTTVAIKGSGFKPGQTYKLAFASMTGNRVGGVDMSEALSTLTEAVAGADGTATFRIKAPDDLGGPHGLVVKDGNKASTGVFSIIPSALPLTASKGPAGAPFSIHLKGVGWTETANIYAMVYDNFYSGYACGFNSQGDVEIQMYATGDPGWHFIDLYPAIYKGQESRPNNFRIPQLTYEADHPGEDLPRFSFAFEIVEGDLQGATR